MIIIKNFFFMHKFYSENFFCVSCQKMEFIYNKNMILWD